MYRVMSVRATDLRDRSTYSIKIVASIPSHVDSSIFSATCCDIILLRNLTTHYTRVTDTVHYFSVCGIKLIDSQTAFSFSQFPSKQLNSEEEKEKYIEITMLIQKTRRADGITTSMVNGAKVRPTAAKSEIGNEKQKEKYKDEDQGKDKASSAIEKRTAEQTKERVGIESALVHNNGFSAHNLTIEMAGLIKSNCLQTLYVPCIVAFAFESGAAAFCSLFQQRMRLRCCILTQYLLSTNPVLTQY